MTTSIDRGSAERLLNPTAAAPQATRVGKMIRAVRVFTVLTAMAGVGVLATAFSYNEWRLATAGSTLVIVAAIGASVWVGSQLLADRHGFYQRGVLDGWMRGWRGQAPESDDPLLRP